MPARATLAEVIRRAMEAALGEVWGAAPGTVLAYSATTQRADVEVAIRRGVLDDSGALVLEDPLVVANVPVGFPGGGGYFISFPVQKDDRVLLVFADRSIDRYLENGEAADPADQRVLGPAGAIAVPLRPLPKGEELQDAHATWMVAGKDGDAKKTYWTGDDVRLTSASDTQFVARADRVEAQLQAIYDAINGAAVVGGDGGAALKANIIAALDLVFFPGSTASDGAKVT